jgi:hypothetical protein
VTLSPRSRSISIPTPTKPSETQEKTRDRHRSGPGTQRRCPDDRRHGNPGHQRRQPYEHSGYSPDGIVEFYPVLTLEDVRTALAYYYAHIKESGDVDPESDAAPA